MPAADYSLLASRFLESGQWERALETSREWLAGEPESPAAHLAAGQSLVNLSREGEARPHLEQVLAAVPENAFAHRLMSIVAFQAGRSKEADESIGRAIALNPHDALHWYHAGHMCYQQGDQAQALKYAVKARALAPRNVAIINLLAMCSPRETAEEREARLQQYLSALEINPESAASHNNVGACYLDDRKDYAAAEACFRRALALSPDTAIFRTNLFRTLRHRDLIYRILCAPRTFLASTSGLLQKARGKSLLLYLLVLPLWLVGIRFLLAGLLLWCLFVWPMVKVYEHLTVGDIHAQAGEIGAQRGGVFGYRRWPLRARLGLFAAALLAFWSGLILFARHEDPGLLIGWGLLVFLPIFLFRMLRKWWKGARGRRQSRRRARTLQNLAPHP